MLASQEYPPDGDLAWRAVQEVNNSKATREWCTSWSTSAPYLVSRGQSFRSIDKNPEKVLLGMFRQLAKFTMPLHLMAGEEKGGDPTQSEHMQNNT